MSKRLQGYTPSARKSGVCGSKRVTNVKSKVLGQPFIKPADCQNIICSGGNCNDCTKWLWKYGVQLEEVY